jgi:hypothetical protein
MHPWSENVTMIVRVTCAGVLIGTARFGSPSGLAHAPLYPSNGYPIAAGAAQTIGEELTLRRLWSPSNGDFADVVAAQWQGGRLALQDLMGREVAVDNLVVLEPPFGGRYLVHLVADFRDVARVGSRSTRPAA